MDGRIASLEATINALVRRMEERFAEMDARMSRIEATVAATQNSIGGLKTTIVVTAIAVVLGVATLNAAVLSNMLASFEAGIIMKISQDKLLRQSEQTEALLKQIQQGLVVPPKK